MKISDLKNTMLLGLLFVAPLAITIWVLTKAVNLVDDTFAYLTPLRFSNIPGAGLVTAVLLLFLVGLLAKTVLGKFLKNFVDEVVERVPIMRSVYRLFLQLGNAFLGEGHKKGFRRVVWVPFPNPHTRALAFVTGELSTGETLVFLPTAPNPTSGYVLAFKPELITEESLSVDEAIKIIVSCGASTNG